ncbi:hypothetical protein AAVH_26425 [Aphelenchoides avenae]|nr:hypothetical protein AAVH_26425 [Aphelenchus avenae]
MWWRLRRKNAAPILPTSARDCSPAEDAPKSNSSQTLKGSTSIAETLAQSSLTDSSAEDAPEPFIASNSCQKINASIGICLTNSRFKVLNVAFDSLWAPTNADDEDSYKEFFRQGRVYLIGTRHFDKDW